MCSNYFSILFLTCTWLTIDFSWLTIDLPDLVMCLNYFSNFSWLFFFIEHDLCLPSDGCPCHSQPCDRIPLLTLWYPQGFSLHQHHWCCRRHVLMHTSPPLPHVSMPPCLCGMGGASLSHETQEHAPLPVVHSPLCTFHPPFCFHMWIHICPHMPWPHCQYHMLHLALHCYCIMSLLHLFYLLFMLAFKIST